MVRGATNCWCQVNAHTNPEQGAPRRDDHLCAWCSQERFFDVCKTTKLKYYI